MCTNFFGLQETDGVSHSSKARRDFMRRWFENESLPASSLWDIVMDVLEPRTSRAKGDPSR